MSGYEVMHNGKCYTVFSAPNYCDQMGNKGAYMVMYGPELKDPECIPFTEVVHPHVKPMQVRLIQFSYSPNLPTVYHSTGEFDL